MPRPVDRVQSGTQLTTRAFGLWRRYWWAALVLAFAVAFGLVLWGAEGGALRRIEAALLLLPMPNPTDRQNVATQVQLAHVIAALVFAYATYRALFAIFGERRQEIKAGLSRAHTVVAGLGSKGQVLAESLLGSTRVVAIELDPTNPAIRRLRDAGAVVLIGDATDPDTARKSGAMKAEHVVSTCGPDAVNARVAATLLTLANSASPPAFDAFVHISDPRLYTFLLHHSFAGRGPRLEFFNVFEHAARRLVEAAGGRAAATPDRILVVGLGQFGLALVSQLARNRFEHAEAGRREVEISVVDRHARERAQLLTARYSRLSEVVTLRAYDLDVESPVFDRLLADAPGRAEVDLAFVCFDNDTMALAVTLNLLDQTQGRLPVIARVSESGGIAGMIESARSRYASTAVFQPVTLAEAGSQGETVLQGVRGQLARQIHEVYRQDHPGGMFDVPWEALPTEGRDRNLRHAAAIASQLETVGFGLGPQIDWGEPPLTLTSDQIETMSRLEHERWRAERLAEGWRHAAARDDSAKLHPDLVPWEDLSEDRRGINRRLVAARPGMLSRVGIQIYRV